MSRQAKPSLVGIARTLGVDAEDGLFERALTHRSYAYESGGLPTNERLEFLGDAVLGLVVTDTLFRLHPDLPEGQLAKLRAAVVNMRALADVGRSLDLGRYVRLGRGEESTGGRDKSSILADTVEAVIGALYIGRGLEQAADFVHRLFDPLIVEASQLGAGLDWKTSLQELTAASGLGVPAYLVEESGPDHEKVFQAIAIVGELEYGSGVGSTKKEAEQRAAETAWGVLRARAVERLQQEAAESDGADAEPAESDGADAEPAADRRAGRGPRVGQPTRPLSGAPCPSCLRSRWSAAAWSVSSCDGPLLRSMSATPVPCGATQPGNRTSPTS